jgi:hypothetical protein
MNGATNSPALVPSGATTCSGWLAVKEIQVAIAPFLNPVAMIGSSALDCFRSNEAIGESNVRLFPL